MADLILFSPVGGNDPMGIDNNNDGSLLHICRHYKPDKVYMYMSDKMQKYEDNDKRFTYCLDKLAELQNRKMEYCFINEENHGAVHEYNYYYKRFDDEIKKIVEENEDASFILNVSSGTPAMKSALQVIDLLHEHPMIPVQVSTPERDINTAKQDRDDYDVETRWELNEDNDDNAENRCGELESFNLKALWKKDEIKRFIEVYDYVAAYEVAQSMDGGIDKDVKDILTGCKYRLKLDLKNAKKYFISASVDVMPKISSNMEEIFEYLLWMNVKLHSEEYMDFIRGLTPILFSLYEKVLDDALNFDIHNICTWDKKKEVWIVDPGKLSANSDIKGIYRVAYGNEFKPGDLYSHHMYNILRAKLGDIDSELLVKIELVNTFDRATRNITAHDITESTLEWINSRIHEHQKKARLLYMKIDPQTVYESLQFIFNRLNKGFDKNYWNSYDDINDKIKDML